MTPTVDSWFSRRRLAVRPTVLLVVLALSVAACGRGIDEEAAGVTTLDDIVATTTTTLAPDTTEPPQPTGEIVVWVPIRQSAAVQEAAGAFTTATGIEVAVETVELDEMENAISGAVGPDLFLGKHTWLARLAPRGLAADPGLAPRVPEFLPIAADAFTYEGVMFGAPVTFESIAFFFNTAVVPTAPGAMSEVKETCVQLRGGDIATTTTEGSSTTTSSTEPVAPVGPACMQYLADDARVTLALITAGDGYLYRRVEGKYLNDDIGIGGPSAAARAETLRTLVADGVLGGSEDSAAMVASFASGETPFLIGDIDLAEALSRSGTPFGVAPLPIITGTTPEPFSEATGWMLAGRSDQPDTALLFLNDYLITAVTMADIFATSSGLPAYLATADLVGADPVLAGLLRAAEGGEPTPTVDDIAEVLATLGPMLAEILNVEGADIEPLLDEATETARRLAA